LWCWGHRTGAVAVLVSDYSTSDSPDPDPSRQPGQFPAKFHYGSQLLRHSVWGVDPCAAVHFDTWSFLPPVNTLLFGFWVTLIFGLGGTTPLPRWLLGRAYEILTFERFTFWATLMAMPLVGILAVEMLDRFRAKAAVGLSLAAVGTVGAALWWLLGKSVPADGDDDECRAGDRLPQS